MALETTVFGEFLRGRLMELDMTLRELARRSGLDASNLSKMERGVAYPPKKKETLERLAAALELEGPNMEQFFDAAAVTNGMLPPDLEHVRANAAIPLLLRAVEKRQMTLEELKRLAEVIERENRWQGRVVE